MKSDPTATDRREREVAERVAKAGEGTPAGKALLERARSDGLSVRTIKRLARGMGKRTAALPPRAEHLSERLDAPVSFMGGERAEPVRVLSEPPKRRGRPRKPKGFGS